MNKIIGAFKADVFRIKGIDKKDVEKKLSQRRIYIYWKITSKDLMMAGI